MKAEKGEEWAEVLTFFFSCSLRIRSTKTKYIPADDVVPDGFIWSRNTQVLIATDH